MKKYIGAKIILATMMSRLDYNNYRGWELPADEKGEDPGYLVEYVDGSTPNHADHEGYISWSPQEVFDKAYRAVEGMSFGLAIEALKLGNRVARAGWNGKGMFLNYHDDVKGFDPFIAINAVTEYRPWLASQADMLSDDWHIAQP